MYRGLLARKAPVEAPEPSAARMILEANAVERLQLRTSKLRCLRKAALFVSVVPDEEGFITGVEGIDLEFVIGIAS